MPEVAATAAGDRPAVVVVALGTNDAWFEQLTVDAAEQALDDIVASFSGACIVTVSISEASSAPGYDRDEARRINGLLAEAADRVAPWGARSESNPDRYLGPDGIHPTQPGKELFATLVHEAVTSCPG